MSRGYLVLYQKQIDHGDYEAARVVTVFKLDDGALDIALKEIRCNFQPWAVSFKELPPKKLLVKACEEAVQRGKAIKLPRSDKR